MNPSRPIFWYQGLFLQPQHFQQLDSYTQSVHTPHNVYQSPHFWGVCSFELREDSLKESIFEVAGGEFVFPDGSWVVFPDNAVIHPRSINTDDLEAGRSFKIYLGLKKWDQKKGNVTILSDPNDIGKVGTRFVTGDEPEKVRDLHHGDSDAPVRLMDHVLRIFFEHEIEHLTDYSLIPVSELTYEDEEFTVSRSYIPPLVTCAGSDSLIQIIHSVREQILVRCRKLEEYKSPREIQSAGFDSTYIVYLLALRSLNRYVPLLFHTTEVRHIHPWIVYGLFRQIVGELSTFTERIDSLGRLMDGTELLPQYKHDDLRHCFEEAQTLISELLSDIIIGPENIIHLKRKGDYFKAEIPVESFENRNVFYLVIMTAENQKKVLNIMKNIAKVSSDEQMSTLIGRSLPGIAMEYSLIPPPGLPTRPNAFYFKLDQAHPHWTEIHKSQNISMYWQKAPKDTMAEVIVLRR
ncbi:MAG: type VI secretion system baseplate subunit TssK [Candidatus Latescibacteria bacterium]|nr:type VI secretion system baseplate subunit TssK [Candidatus Latescibacterota bacterium]